MKHLKGWETVVMRRIFRLGKRDEERWASDASRSFSRWVRLSLKKLKIALISKLLAAKLWRATGLVDHDETVGVIKAVKHAMKWEVSH